MKPMVSVRLDAELRRRLEEFRASSGLETPSQALRAVLVLGLERSEKLDVTWRKIAALEAARHVSARVRMKLDEALQSIWKDGA
jgi:hypothetical protein